MRLKQIFFVLAFIFGEFQICSALKISEVMPCNLSTYMERDYFNFSGFIELYNDGADTVSLRSWSLVHYKLKKDKSYELKWSWDITRDISLPPHSYSLLWMDEKDKGFHAPFKLDADGGYLLMYNKDLLVDSLAYGEMDAHVSYGRYGEEEGYMEPSPAKKNTLAYVGLLKNARCKKVKTDLTPGIYEEPFYLTLSSNTSDAEIYYTTNGTEPSRKNGKKYQSPIYVDQNLTLRARAYNDELMPSKMMAATYLFPDEKHTKCGGYTIPIVSIIVDSLYFYNDSVGIYVKGVNGISGEKSCTSSRANYNRDWKRPVSFEYMVDGLQVLTQEVEASVEGGCSRTNVTKTLELKASKKTGDKDYDYYFFQSKPDIKHQTLYLRNGGTAYSKVRFRDGLMQTFAIGMNVDYQAYQPVAYYLNGKYVGLMNLNERTNSDYIKANYDLDEDEIDLITISDQRGVRASDGDKTAYDELVSYLKNEDPSDSSYYRGACERMDMEEYMDYQVIEQFIVNTDWPGNNTKMWREKNGGKFRWILMDTDFGFGLPGYEYMSTSNKNMLNWCQGKGSLQWANSSKWMTQIFSNLSKNLEFRKKFVTCFQNHLATIFSQERINAVFDSITAIVDQEYCASFGTSAITAAKSMRTFALAREQYIQKQLVAYLGETDVKDVKSLPLTLCYYNVESQEASLMTDESMLSVGLYSVNGQLLAEWSPFDTYWSQNMSAYQNGVYLLRVVFDKGVVTKKLVKQE